MKKVLGIILYIIITAAVIVVAIKSGSEHFNCEHCVVAK